MNKVSLTLAVFFVLSVACSEALVGNKRCTWGPSYWCTHMGTAKECGSEKYCARIWKSQKVEVKETVQCTFCKLFVQDIDTMLKNNKTVDEIRQLVEKACTLLPGAEQPTCKALVDGYLPQIIAMLESKLNPEQLCVAISLCTSSGIIKDPFFTKITKVSLIKAPAAPLLVRGVPVPVTVTKLSVNSVFCDDCKKILTDIKTALEANKTEAEIADFIKNQVCTQLGPLKDTCSQTVDQYLPEIIQLLDSQLQPLEICTVLGFCTSASQKTSVVKPLKIKDAFCDDCVLIVGDVKKAISSNATVAEISNLLKAQLCAQLGPLKDECNNEVDALLPVVIQWIQANVQPQQICALLGFCTGARKTTNYKKHPAILLMKLQKKGGLPIVKDTVECSVCELLVTEARKLITQNKTEQEIIDFLVNRVCTILPAEKDECVKAVTEYGPIIFQLLASELDPTTVCQAIGACGKSAKKVEKQMYYPKAGPQCILCEYVISQVDLMLGNNKTEAAIINALDKVCSILPATIRQECESFVNQYAPAIIKLLASAMNPKMVCTALGLCAPGSVKPMVYKKVSAGEECLICQTVVLYGKQLLNEKATQDEITKVLEKVCNFLPQNERPACNAFIAEYGPMLIQTIVQDINPKAICTDLHICTSQKNTLVHSNYIRNPLRHFHAKLNPKKNTLVHPNYIRNPLRHYHAKQNPNGMVHMVQP